MKFRYIGEYPGGKDYVDAFGYRFTKNAEVEIDSPPAKLLTNRFFKRVEAYELVPVEPDEGDLAKSGLEWDYDPLAAMEREDLIALAEEKCVKIDKRWNAEKIATAIKDAANGK